MLVVPVAAPFVAPTASLTVPHVTACGLAVTLGLSVASAPPIRAPAARSRQKGRGWRGRWTGDTLKGWVSIGA
jgi:hypothetical protein